jgi:PAS domain-containing protein
MTLEELYRVLRSSHVQSQGVLDTLSQPLLVLDRGFSVVTANPTFYRAFHTDREATVGKSIFDLGDGQWNNAGLRALLQDVVPKSVPVVGHRIEHNFPEVGQRTMLVSLFIRTTTARRCSLCSKTLPNGRSPKPPRT